VTDWCDFRGRALLKRELKYARVPGYGELSRGLHKTVRCPVCNKRLQLRAVYCVGGEFAYWAVPDHKPRVTRKPGPRRAQKRARRGC
jgi:hypothetical protein